MSKIKTIKPSTIRRALRLHQEWLDSKGKYKRKGRQLHPTTEAIRKTSFDVSDIEVNVSIGTIFSVLHMPEESRSVQEKDFLQPGSRQVAAGYCIYGPQTTLVLTVGDGVASFTLDREQGSFVLTQDNLCIPEDTHEFAINMSNMRHWDAPVRRYIDECQIGRAHV